MRNTQKFEIVGIGNFEVYPIKAQELKLKVVNDKGEELVKLSGKNGNNGNGSVSISESSYFWADTNGNKYSQDLVFYEVGGKKFQKIKRTDVVKNYEVVESNAWTDLADEVGTAILGYNKTTENNFKDKVGDKAVKFKLKKADVGFKFYWAYVYEDKGKLVMTTGRGSRIDGYKQFDSIETGKSKGLKEVKNVVEVSACDLEQDLLI